jgi:hypothetical protein
MNGTYSEVSIRYIGLAILSSGALAVGTAKVMRGRQVQGQRYQRVFTQVFNPKMVEDGDRPSAELTDPVSPTAGLGESAQAWTTSPGLPTLDWTSLSPPNLILPTALPDWLATPTPDHRICQVQGDDQRYRLALEMGDQYYHYYRRCPDADRAQRLIEGLRGQGKAAMATQDGSEYIIWLHQPASP